MEMIKSLKCLITLLTLASAISSVPVSGQITTACTTSMIRTFTPCLSVITGSSYNGSSPIQDCCNSLAQLITSGTDCACLIVTGNVPLRLPINRTLAISLPRACNQPGVPLQCRGSAAPLPAPGPMGLGVPSPSPSAASPDSPSVPPLIAPSPPAGVRRPSPPATVLEPASAPTDSEIPETPANPGRRPLILPSAAIKPPITYSQSLLLCALIIMILKYC